jgi:hypothetical protein
MIRVISSPSSSTTGFLTSILLNIVDTGGEISQRQSQTNMQRASSEQRAEIDVRILIRTAERLALAGRAHAIRPADVARDT